MTLKMKTLLSKKIDKYIDAIEGQNKSIQIGGEPDNNSVDSIDFDKVNLDNDALNIDTSEVKKENYVKT